MSKLKPTTIPRQQGTPGFGFRIDYVVKDWFFNSERVINILDATERDVLRKFGGYVRSTSRRSMKNRPATGGIDKKTGERRDLTKRKGYASKPGEPPHAHALGEKEKVKGSKRSKRKFSTKADGGYGGLKYGPFNVVYGYDPERRSVVIGPRSKRNSNRLPFVLEYGGKLSRRFPGSSGFSRKVGDYGVIKFDTQPPKKPDAKGCRKVTAPNGQVFYVYFAKIRNEKMLERVRRNEEIVFGNSNVSTASTGIAPYIAPRPYMRPAYNKALKMLPKFWHDAEAKSIGRIRR